MSVIGTLSAVLECRISNFEQGMKRGQAAMGETAKRATSMGTSLLKLAAPAAMLGTVALAARAMGESFKRMDELVDVADNIGITTDSLIGLRFAAEEGASSAEGMDAALATMNRNVGLAAMGSGRAGKAIEQLGINMDDLHGMAPDKMFGTFADAISNVADKQEQAALASRIFGDEGSKLLSVLRGGSAGLKAANDEADRMGLLFGVGAKEAAAAADSLRRMDKTVGALGDSIAVKLAPAVSRLEGLLKQNGKGIASWAAAAGEVLADIAEAAVDLTVGLPPSAGLPNPGNKAAEEIETIKATCQAAEPAVEKVTKALMDLEEQYTVIAMSDFDKKMRDFAKLGATPEDMDQVGRLLKMIEMHDELNDKMKEQQKIQEALARSAEDLIDRMRSPAEVLQEEMEKVLDLFNQGMIDFVTFSRATANLQEQFEKDNAPRGGGQRSVGFMAEGSAAAFSAANSYRNSGADDLARQQLRKQVEQLKEAVGIRQAIENGFQKIETFEF